MQVEGIYTAEPRFEAKAKALKLKQEMAAAAEEEQRAQKEKQYAQERNYGGGFGSGSAYMAGEKPQKTTNTGFSGGQRGGFGSQHVQEPQTVQDTDTTLGWKLLRVYLKTPDAPGQRAFSRRAASFFLEIRQYSCEKMSCAARKFLAAGHIGSFQIHPRILNAGSGKFFSGFGQAGSKIVGGLEEVEQYLNGGWTSDGQYVKGDSPIVSSLLGWVHGAADDVTAQANAELDRSARNWSDTKAGQVFNEVAVNGVAAIPQAMLAFGTGGASTAGQLGAQAGTLETALRSLVSNPRFWLAYGQNAGESYAKAKAAGASDSDALVAGTFTGLTNAMIDLGGGYENSGWMSDRSLNGGQVVKNLGKSVLEQSGEEYAKGAAGRMAEKLYTPDKQWFSTKDENAVFNPKRDARQLAADAATAALVEGSGYAARRFFDEFQLSEEDFDNAFERGYNAEEEWKGQNDQAIRDQIRSEPEKLIINPEKQARHVRESKGYIPGRSYLTISESELQKIVNQYAGTGEMQKDMNGNFIYKELLILDRIVGVNVNRATGVATPTNKVYIYYSKTGTHVVPTLKGE